MGLDVIMRRVSHVSMARWRPAAFTALDVRITSWILVVMAVVRGTDYLRSGNAIMSPSLATIEKAFPIMLWGGWFCFGAGILAIGLLISRHFLVWFGYTILFIGYALLGVGLIIPFLPADVGFRTGVQTIYVAGVHFLLMIRTGYAPLTGHTVTVSRTQAGD